MFFGMRDKNKEWKKGDKDDRMRYKGNSTTGHEYFKDEEEE